MRWRGGRWSAQPGSPAAPRRCRALRPARRGRPRARPPRRPQRRAPDPSSRGWRRCRATCETAGRHGWGVNARLPRRMWDPRWRSGAEPATAVAAARVDLCRLRSCFQGCSTGLTCAGTYVPFQRDRQDLQSHLHAARVGFKRSCSCPEAPDVREAADTIVCQLEGHGRATRASHAGEPLLQLLNAQLAPAPSELAATLDDGVEVGKGQAWRGRLGRCLGLSCDGWALSIRRRSGCQSLVSWCGRRKIWYVAALLRWLSHTSGPWPQQTGRGGGLRRRRLRCDRLPRFSEEQLLLCWLSGNHTCC